MDEQTRLLTLAHLKNGMKPADAAELTGVSYSSALKLKRELHAAEERNTTLQLFKLDRASLEILLDAVKKQLQPAIEAFGVGELVEAEVDNIADSVENGKVLSQELQDSAKVLTSRITSVALTSTNSETLLTLTKALCELQRSFFGESSTGASNLPMSSFEQHLRN